jgi:hypothetical protein
VGGSKKVNESEGAKMSGATTNVAALVVREYLWEEGLDTHGDDGGEDFVVRTKESYWAI